MTNYSYADEQVLPVFVYGSLRVGYHNSPLIDQYPHVRSLGAVEGFDMYAQGRSFPYAVYGEGEIVGEIVDFDADVFPLALRSLDRLEGYDPHRYYNDFYVRITVTVTSSQGEEVKAWMYVAADSHAKDVVRSHEQIESGDWHEYLPLSAFPRREVR